MKTRVIALAIMLCIMAAAMVACQPAAPVGAEVTATVTITAKDGTSVLNETFTFNSDAPTVEMALTEACAKAEVELVLTSYGTIEKLGDIALEEDDFWEVKVDGKEVAFADAFESGKTITVTVGTIVAG